MSVISQGSFESVTSTCSPEAGKIALAFKFEGTRRELEVMCSQSLEMVP